MSHRKSFKNEDKSVYISEVLLKSCNVVMYLTKILIKLKTVYPLYTVRSSHGILFFSSHGNNT